MGRALLAVALGLGVFGCENGLGLGKGNVLRVEVELAENPAGAGAESGYTASLVGGGDGPIAVEVDLSSDIELNLDHDDDSLVAFLAGTHGLTARTRFEKSSYETTVEWVVGPGAAHTLDLVLEDAATPVGQPLGMELEILDLWGNAHPPEVATITVEPEAPILDWKVSSTVPGLYTVTAAFELLEDTEQFVVLSGTPVTMELTLSDMDLELHETTVADVVFYDLYGNVVESEWLLWTDPADDVTIRHNLITFDAEGNFMVYAASADSALMDAVGPLHIDSTGPELGVVHPPRGHRTTDSSDTATGTAVDEWSGVSEVSVNGEICPVDELGSWECPVTYDFGMNLLQTEATDGDGNPTTDTRAALSGSFTPYGDGVDPGIMARVNESGFDVLEDMASGFIDTSTIAGAIPSPVFYDISQWQECFDPCFGIWGGCEFCWTVTWYEIAFYLQNFSISGTELDIDPKAGGYLDTMARILNPYMDWSASGSVVGISYSSSGYVMADNIQLDMDLTPSVSGGQLHVATSNVSGSTTNFDFDLDSWVYDVVQFFGINVDAIVEGYMVDALVDMAESEVPDLVNDALSDLEIAESFDMDGQTYHLDALPSDVSVDEYGLTLEFASYVTADSWEIAASPDPGSLVYPYTPPALGNAGTQMELALGQDFINQVFFALWGGGMLDMEQTETDLGLDMDELSLFLPSLSALTVQTEALLPPVAVPGTGTALLDMQIGDLALSLFDGEPIESNLFLRVYVSLIAGLDLTATAQNTLSAALSDIEVYFDVVAPTDGSRYTASTEAFLEALMPLLLPSLTDSLGEIPVPDFAGFTLGALGMTLEGPEWGYLVASGDLQ